MKKHVLAQPTGAPTPPPAECLEQELTRRILEAMPGGVVRVAADGAILHANPAACRVLGLRLDELTQRFTTDFAVETINEDGSTGTGVAAETAARVFDPFFSTKTNGRGLGFAATLGIVRSHRSAIELSSELGAGTRYRVYLPVSGRSRFVSQPPALVAADLQGGRLLVIDDEPAVLDIACSPTEALQPGCSGRGSRSRSEAQLS